jgi:hypothetical protein
VAGLLLSLLLVAGLLVWGLLDRQPYEATPPSAPVAQVRPTLAARTLRDLEQAVADRDPGAARGLAADGDDRAAALLASVVANARSLRVRDFTLRYVDEEGALAPDGSWSAAVDATWGFAGFDRTPARTEVTVRFVDDGDRVALAGVGGDGHRAPLWLSAPVQVRRTPDTLVLAAGSSAQADDYARRAAAAVPVVRRVLPAWRPRLVVEVPASGAALDRTLAADPGQYANIAAVTTTVDGSVDRGAPVHVFVNPDVFGRLEPQGAQVVMSHEAVHVATDAATSDLPLWLLEGFADYVALRDVDLPLSTTAGQVIRQVRRNGPPDHLPGRAEFDTGATALGAAYESAWLACRLLARSGGEQALVRLYRLVDGGRALASALRATFGLTPGALTRAWRRSLSDLAA